MVRAKAAPSPAPQSPIVGLAVPRRSARLRGAGRTLAAALLSLAPLALAGCSDSGEAPGADLGTADLTAPTEADLSTGPTADLRDPGPVGPVLPGVPLSTRGRFIVDTKGQRVKLAGVNWYGAEEKDYVVAGLNRAPLAAIARNIRTLGYNVVRLPWSNEMVEKNPVVADGTVTQNPALKGKRALEVLDAVVAALAAEGIMIVLDNHMSDAEWCCTEFDDNGLWYNARYPETSFIADWQTLARRYKDQPAVVGADLRNELRPARFITPTWGTGSMLSDWRAAAQRAAEAILQIAPSWLIVVQGLSYSGDFSGAYTSPIRLTVPNRVVYAPHDYSWFHSSARDYETIKRELGERWGFLLVQDQTYTAPVWVGEFGTCNDSAACVDQPAGVDANQGFWFASFRRYLAEADIDWAYWTLNGTQARGTGRDPLAPEDYGILKENWQDVALPALQESLKKLQPITQTP